MAENIPQAPVGIVETFLAVNLEDIARPGHIDLYDILNFTRAMRHDDDAISQEDRFVDVVRDEIGRASCRERVCDSV